MRTVILFAAAGAIATATIPVSGQQAGAADLAQRLSGTWMINWKLSPSFGVNPGGRSGGGVLPVAAFQQRTSNPYPQGVRANPTNTEPTSSKASDLTPAELAERTATRQITQVMPQFTLTVTADHLTLEDDRGEQNCNINGKSGKERTFGVYMDVKCKWEKGQLRQEFATSRSKFIRLWSLDANGRLVLKGKLEGIDQNSPEATAVYDRS